MKQRWSKVFKIHVHDVCSKFASCLLHRVNGYPGPHDVWGPCRRSKMQSALECTIEKKENSIFSPQRNPARMFRCGFRRAWMSVVCVVYCSQRCALLPSAILFKPSSPTQLRLFPKVPAEYFALRVPVCCPHSADYRWLCSGDTFDRLSIQLLVGLPQSWLLMFVRFYNFNRTQLALVLRLQSYVTETNNGVFYAIWAQVRYSTVWSGIVRTPTLQQCGI